MYKRFLLLAALAICAIAFASLRPPRGARADDSGWVVKSFAAAYQIDADGSIDATEDISVDFGSQQKHGIFRYIPVRYKYDDHHDRVLDLKITSIDDGQSPLKYTTDRDGRNVVLKIGDPNKTVSGAQRYRLRYKLSGALNAQDQWDEFYWNVNGTGWPVPIQAATASVNAPGFAATMCFQGPQGSNQPCPASVTRSDVVQQGSTAHFAATRPLQPGEQLTIVAGVVKNAVAVPPPIIVRVKTPAEQVRDFVGLKPLPIALAVIVGVLGLVALLRYWWLAGRDRWFGDVHYLTGDTNERRRPLMAKDTIVVEYQPPELSNDRRLRPAEIGTLLDERADTLDVSATIVDLAVRGYLKIIEVPKEGLLGHKDYRLEKRKAFDQELLPYEARLHTALFETGDSVLMSDLKMKFADDLKEVKSALYTQVVAGDAFFPNNPETVRLTNLGAGVAVIAIGAVLAFVLGSVAGAAIVALPLIPLGLLLMAMSGAMPRRTGAGREMYRRCLGFREYMVVAETDRQKFNEEAGIFEKYLPFAIVYNCVEKWAHAFEGLDRQAAAATSGWYVGTGVFLPLAFAQDVQSFSSQISTVIAATPASTGGSGFSGGFSGGGFGGGGGGSW